MKLLFSSLLLLLVSVTVSPAQESQPPATSLRVSYVPMKDAPEVPQETKEQLLAWITDFLNTVHRMRNDEFQRAVNWRELVLISAASDEALPDAKVERLAKAMAVSTERTLPYLKPTFAYTHLEIRRIDLQGDSATIVARGHGEDEIETKARWWLRRLEGSWQMVDFENVTASVRFSTIMSQVLQAQPDTPVRTKEVSAKFLVLSMAIQDGDSEKVQKLADELLALKLPAGIREIILLMKVAFLDDEGDLEKVDAVLAELEKAGSTNPVYFLMRAERSRTKEDYQECISWTRKYGAAIGHDSDSWEMLVECHQELGQEKETLQAAKDWVAEYPQSSMAMYSYWQALPEKEQATTIRPLLSALPPEAESFEDFGTEAYLNDDVAALKLLIEVMKTLKMTKEDLEEWESSLKEITEAANTPEKPKAPETSKL